MIIISEKIAQQTVKITDAIAAVKKVFSAMEKGKAENYPVVRESLESMKAVFGVKSGYDGQGMALGLKAGGYWSENLSRGLENHQSGILLFDHGVSQQTLDEIRESANRGWALGSLHFLEKVESLIDRSVRKQPRGGDRKSVGYHRIRKINRN